MYQYLLSPALTFAVSLVTLAATWGILKATVDHLKEEMTRLRTSTEEHGKEISCLREEVRVTFAELSASKPGKVAASRRRARR